MRGALTVLAIAPGVTVQDEGRPGWLMQGLSRGGAADRLALAEGAALLGQSPACAAFEMVGAGGRFRAERPLRIALTGAEMDARIDGRALRWTASHRMEPGDVLEIGGARRGSYGYLHVGGGLDTAVELGSRAAHLTCRIGRRVAAGDSYATGPDPGPEGRAQVLAVEDRLSGGTLRLVPGPQTELFPEPVRAHLETLIFRRLPRASRQGVPLGAVGGEAGLDGAAGLTVVSDLVQPGDVQVLGDGTPMVLGPECQTTGGYPRLGRVHPADLPRALQAPPGADLRFAWITPAEALRLEAARRAATSDLPSRLSPLVRHPSEVPDLLTRQLIGGVVSGHPDHHPLDPEPDSR